MQQDLKKSLDKSKEELKMIGRDRTIAQIVEWANKKIQFLEFSCFCAVAYQKELGVKIEKVPQELDFLAWDEHLNYKNNGEESHHMGDI